jgi:transposase
MKHYSDCAVHNEPAFPAGPCNCGGYIPKDDLMPGGRPSKYQESFCDEIINLMAEGYSLTAAASVLGIHKDTVYAWEKEIPEFSDAVKLARGKRTYKLETDLLQAKEGPIVTSRIFALKNACADEWREKVTQEQTGPDGGAVQHSHVHRIERAIVDTKN